MLCEKPQARAQCSRYSCVLSREEAQEKLEKRKPILGLVKQVLAIWEELRPREADRKLKRELANKILATGKGKLRELSMKHASSRVVQAALKHGGDSAAQAVWAESKAHAVEMAMSPHASHVLRKLLRIGNKDLRTGAARQAERRSCWAACVKPVLVINTGGRSWTR
jgi:hypothetical protein